MASFRVPEYPNVRIFFRKKNSPIQARFTRTRLKMSTGAMLKVVCFPLCHPSHVYTLKHVCCSLLLLSSAEKNETSSFCKATLSSLSFWAEHLTKIYIFVISFLHTNKSTTYKRKVNHVASVRTRKNTLRDMAPMVEKTQKIHLNSRG